MDTAQKFKELTWKYGFKLLRDGTKRFNLCAQNTDQCWTRWICYDSERDKVIQLGNTDSLNIWLAETRKDFTPEKCLQFVDDLNKVFGFSGKDKFLVKDLIDPEDWQDIAQVQDAYKDQRYVTGKVVSLDERIEKAASSKDHSGASFDLGRIPPER